jgi:hypothetical protein
MALLVVLALFPKVIAPTIEGVARGAVTLGITIPVDMIRLSGSALEDPLPAVPSSQPGSTASPLPNRFDESFVVLVAERFARALDKAMSIFTADIMQRLPLKDLAIPIVVWFLLALFIHQAFVQGLPSRLLAALRVGSARLGQLLRLAGTSASQNSWLNWSNGGFLLILTTGIFLSMAAITSLPRLREHSKPNSEVNADSLKRDLSELQLSQSEIENYYGGDIPGQIVTFDQVRSLPGTTQPDEGAKPVSPVTSDTSKSREGVRESKVDAKKVEPPAIATKESEKRSAENIDSGTNGNSARESPNSPKGGETDSALTLAARKANLVAAEADLERANSELSGGDWSDMNKKNEQRRILDAALRRASDARDQVDLANQEIRLATLVEEEANRLDVAWSGMVIRSKSLKDFVHSDEAQSLSSAVREYSAQNIERQGSREEITHFLWIREWYAEKINSHRSALRLCGEQLRSLQSEGAGWTSAMRRILVRTDNLTDAYSKTGAVLRETESVDNLLTANVCEIPVAAQIPAPPPLGDSLGPLRFMAGWLLNADSLPLCLIVGLVGFGLLGAAISTFVKERLEARLMSGANPKVDVIVSDLAGVALRGISAAIVVFLAVQGGLAVLSGAGSDPNPYVLLLACFVAAVFSERVWQKAYEYLRVQLASDGKTEGTREKMAAEETLPQESK